MTNRFQCHIVQISQDAAIFTPEKDAEPLERQLCYGRELARLAPGSRMTIIVLTTVESFAPSTRDGVEFIPCSGGRLIGRLKLWRVLNTIHTKRPIDVIATQTVFDEAWLALLFAKFHGCRVVGQIHFDIFSNHALQSMLGIGFFGRMRALIGRTLLRKFVVLRVVGCGIKKKLMAENMHYNVEVLPVPVNILRARNLTTHRVNSRRVLYVGRLALEKNLEQWLSVAALVASRDDNVEFHIVGDGPCRERLQQLAAHKGLAERVHFHGHVPNDRLSEFYNSASVFLLTSFYEGFGRVLVESYAYGTPVVAPRIVGVEDIVEDGETGFLLPSGDLEGMANAVLRLLNDPELAEQLGWEGEKNVRKRFDPDRLTTEWVSLLVSAVRSLPPQILLPRRRTWARWREIGFSRYTLLRSLQYEAIRGIVLEGRTLDVGGGKNTSYSHLFDVRGVIESVNINPEMKPTLIADLNHPLPIESETYDNVISLNTFEHIRDDTSAISESLRVLKKGGKFHFVIPFLYQVHASPHDYHRHTALWWIEFLISQGVGEDNFVIEPLVWDRISSAYSFLGHGRFGLRLKRLVTLIAVIKDMGSNGEVRLANKGFAHRTIDVALGFYISGHK